VNNTGSSNEQLEKYQQLEKENETLKKDFSKFASFIDSTQSLLDESEAREKELKLKLEQSEKRIQLLLKENQNLLFKMESNRFGNELGNKTRHSSTPKKNKASSGNLF
jgi:hypothetical protein